MIWVDIRRPTGRVPFYDAVATRDFTNSIDAREWADAQLRDMPRCYAIVSDDRGELYRIGNDRPPSESPLTSSPSHFERGNPIYTTD